ncbi:unnamed protein product, partial [Porites lobata]
ATSIWSWTVQKNKKGGNATTHRNPLKKVQNIANSLDLIDVWRTLNPDGKRFTWRRTKPKFNHRNDILYFTGCRTDHALTTIHLASNNYPRGPGFWKLNTSFLLDSEYIEIIKKTIDEVAMENRNNDDVDVVLLW